MVGFNIEESRSIIAHMGVLTEFKNNLKEITGRETKNYQLLGQPFGQNIEHCILLGLRFCENFESRVKYYAIQDNFKNDIRTQVQEIISKVIPYRGGVNIDFYEDGKPNEIMGNKLEMISFEEFYQRNELDAKNIMMQMGIESLYSPEINEAEVLVKKG